MRLNNAFIFLFISILFIYDKLLSDEPQQPNSSGLLEAGLFTNYRNYNDKRNFLVNAVSPIWDRNYMLTHSFEYGTLLNVPEHLWPDQKNKFYQYGWTHCGSYGDLSASIIWDTLGYALYKISCTSEFETDTQTSYFYLDWRDDRYKDDFPFFRKKDFAIIFDEEKESNRFAYCMLEIDNFTEIQDSSAIGVWEILQASPPNPRRIKFQPTTPTNLHYESANGHPRLSWNLSEPQEAASYEVWRKVCSNPPKYLVIVEDWRCVQSLPAGTNNWTDNEFQISGTVNQVSYKVRAVSGDGNLYSPSFSNTVTITGEYLPFDRQPSPAVCLQSENPSISIFPNPFNSTIRIALDSPAEPITEMVIFDLKGRVVRRFRSFSNPYQITATWDGRGDQNQPLTSGVYCLLIHTAKHRLFREKIVFIK